MVIRRCGELFIFYLTFSILFYLYINYSWVLKDVSSLRDPNIVEQHKAVVFKYYDMRKDWVTSNLGTYLFKYNERRSYKPRPRVFNVLIWKHWQWLKTRHTEHYGEDEYDPLSGCSVSNCNFTDDDSPEDVYKADAVVVHLHKGLLPDFERSDPSQLWIFWSDESPNHTFTMCGRTCVPPTFTQVTNLFNWSMTYRSDSDIPIPYGRTIPLPYPKLDEITDDGLKQLVPFWDKKRRDVLAANIMSRCSKFRMMFLKRLRRYMSIDTFGTCATIHNNTHRCPGHYRRDCLVVSEYLFYIVMENSNCRQYITEKVFHHGYAKGAIPIIMGAPLEDCIKLLPPNSFIHADSYKSLQALAKDVYSISNNVTRYLSYHAWRNHFDFMEEHGFLGTRSFALCRLCEALNYNDMSPKEYGLYDILLYLDPRVCCGSST